MDYNQLLSATPGWFFAHSAGGGLYAWIGRNISQGSVIYTSAGTWVQNTWAAVELAGDGTSIYAAQSLAAAHDVTAMVNPVNPTGVPPFNAHIGVFPATASEVGYRSGDLSAVYIWDRKLSVAERAQVAAYVLAVWGVS
jgi:hypothetical protein